MGRGLYGLTLLLGKGGSPRGGRSREGGVRLQNCPQWNINNGGGRFVVGLFWI